VRYSAVAGGIQPASHVKEKFMATKIDLLEAFADLLAEKIVTRMAGTVATEEEEKAPVKVAPAAKAAKGKAAPAAKGKAAAKAVTLVEVRDALRDVSQKLGKDVAVGILGEFDCAKVSEVEEGDYAELVKACNEALAAGEEEADEDDDI